MNEVIKTLVTRNSCRSYKPAHISREEIDTLLAAGLNAPSGKNMQTARFVVVQDDETVALLSKMNAAVMNAATDPFYGAKDVIIVLAEKSSPNYVYDGSLAVGNLLNAAWAMGLGACWINRAKEVFDTEEGKALLQKWGLTEDVEGIAFCIVGYEDQPKPKIEPKPGRVFFA